LVAQQFGIRWSFGISLPLVLVSLWLASALGGTDSQPGPAQARAD
jgi:hypothetical protein